MFGNTIFLENCPRSVFVIHCCTGIVNAVVGVEAPSGYEQTLAGIAQEVTEVAFRTKVPNLAVDHLQTRIRFLVSI